MPPARPAGRDRENDDQKIYRESSPDSTVQILERAQKGDQQALDILCARYVRRLNRWATGRLPARVRGAIDTGDIVQESLLRSLAHLEKFQLRHSGAFSAYLRQAVLNRIRDEIRAAARAPELIGLDGREPDRAPSPLEETIGHDLQDQFERAFAELDEGDRALIFLRFELEMTHGQVARALDKPSADAARQAVNRALVRLARELTVEAGT